MTTRPLPTAGSALEGEAVAVVLLFSSTLDSGAAAALESATVHAAHFRTPSRPNMVGG